MKREFSVSSVLLLAAIILFVLYAFGVGDNDTVNLGWIGMSSFAASFLIP